jgi:hypothetical protein
MSMPALMNWSTANDRILSIRGDVAWPGEQIAITADLEFVKILMPSMSIGAAQSSAPRMAWSSDVKEDDPSEIRQALSRCRDGKTNALATRSERRDPSVKASIHRVGRVRRIFLGTERRPGWCP